MHRRHLTVLAVTAVLLLAAGYVTFDRDLVLRTRTITATEMQDDTSVDGFAERFVELTDGGRTAARLEAVMFPYGEGQHQVRINIYRPDPPLHSLSVRLDPQLPLNAERLRLEVPPSSWSPFTYRRDRNGSLRVDVDGLRHHTTTVEFALDTHGIDPDQLQDTLPVTVDVDLRPSKLPITAVSGRAHFELPITATSPRQR